MSALDAPRLITTLNRHGVRYVIVGGMAAVAHGSPLPTEDVDIAPLQDAENMARLADALEELDARIRTGDPDGVAFPINAGFLAAQPHMLNLTTVAGDLDLTITPSGFPSGYEGLVDNAVALDLGDGIPTNGRLPVRRHHLEGGRWPGQGSARPPLPARPAPGTVRGSLTSARDKVDVVLHGDWFFATVLI